MLLESQEGALYGVHTDITVVQQGSSSSSNADEHAYQIQLAEYHNLVMQTEAATMRMIRAGRSLAPAPALSTRQAIARMQTSH